MWGGGGGGGGGGEKCWEIIVVNEGVWRGGRETLLGELDLGGNPLLLE